MSYFPSPGSWQALFAWGLAVVPVAADSTLSLAEPLTAALPGVLVLGERLGVVSGAGLLFGRVRTAGGWEKWDGRTAGKQAGIIFEMSDHFA